MLLDQKDLQWRRRAITNWLKFGDRNTKFYHACANARRQSNHIMMIHDVQGLKWESSEGVKEAFVKYFSDLFTARPANDMEPCLRYLSRCETEEKNAEILQDFNMEEV